MTVIPSEVEESRLDEVIVNWRNGWSIKDDEGIGVARLLRLHSGEYHSHAVYRRDQQS